MLFRSRNEKGTDSDVGRAYNQFWWDRGSRVVGNKRTSLVVDPADGRIPYTSAGAKRVADAGPAFGGRRGTDGPEDRSLWERCITRGLASTILPTLYNNNIRIAQAPGYVAIVHEMIHETRVVPLDGSPFTGVRSYLGESRGRWEGDTLVIESRNFNGRAPFRGAGANLRLTER